MPPLQSSTPQRAANIPRRLGALRIVESAARLRTLLIQTIAFVVLALIARSWTFHYSVIDWDESVYLIVAQQWLNGGLPYVDVWDSHPVGLAAFFALLGSLFGDMLLSARVAAALATATVAMLVSYSARRHFDSPLGGWFAGAFYVLVVSGIYGLSANTEIFNNLLITSGVLLLLDAFLQPGKWRVPLAGLCFGAALQIKYQVIPEVALISLLYLGLTWSAHGMSRALTSAALLLVTGLAPTFAVVIYYVVNGQLEAFLDANVRSNLAYVALSIDEADLKRRLIIGARLLLAPALAGAMILLPPVWSRISTRFPVARIWLAVWLFAAGLDVLMPLKFWDHYFLMLAPPMCLIAGLAIAAAWRLGSYMGRITGAFGVLLLAMVVTTNMRQAESFRTARTPDVPRLIANEILSAGNAKDGVYVYDYQPVIYYLTGVRGPTPFILPVELSTYSQSAGIDGLAELRRILATQPRYIVVASPAAGFMPKSFHAEMSRALTNYTIQRDYSGAGGALLYRRLSD